MTLKRPIPEECIMPENEKNRARPGRIHLIGTLLPFLLICLAISACSTVPIPTPREILGADRGEKIFLGCNLWHTESLLIPVENYPKGRILTAGSEVELISYDEERITFSDANGRIFTLLHNTERTMMPAAGFIKTVFTLKNPLDGLDDETSASIRKGDVAKGMTKDQVFAAWGMPMLTRTPNWPLNNTWTYWADIDKYRKAVFKQEKLLETIE